MYGLSVDGLEENSKEIDRISKALRDGIQEQLEALGEQIVADINSNIQDGGHVMTGETLSHSQVFNRGYHFIEVGNDAEWIEWLEHGRGPVVPVTAKVLHFIAKDGTEVFTKYVGPTEPTMVIESAIIKNTENAGEFLVEKVDAEIE